MLITLEVSARLQTWRVGSVVEILQGHGVTSNQKVRTISDRIADFNYD